MEVSILHGSGLKWPLLPWLDGVQSWKGYFSCLTLSFHIWEISKPMKGAWRGSANVVWDQLCGQKSIQESNGATFLNYMSSRNYNGVQRGTESQLSSEKKELIKKVSFTLSHLLINDENNIDLTCIYMLFFFSITSNSSSLPVSDESWGQNCAAKLLCSVWFFT